ncbi:MAG: hypothetical protein N2323_03985 [candidate division WOR-3 bacterium]|nr:hypothetical protein [candidate division WOR-3 bacterium]MCX7837101.1 hypothetical protein [candidate division WOR-3 bacterium]MDW8114477.1 hypothetical protein [candidate division WOR-3 bacterium]
MNFLIILFLLFQNDSLKSKKEPYEIGEEIITGEKRIIINEMKILKLPQIDPFNLLSEKFSLKDIELNKEIVKFTDSIFLSHSFLSFPYFRLPLKEKVLKENLIIFLPEFEKGVKNWELIIYSQKGEIIKRINNKGEPPKAIYWDLKKENGEYINVDEIYYAIFTASDFLGNETKILTPTFFFDGLIYQEKNKKIILINPEKIFKEETKEIKEEGFKIIEEICNIIKNDLPKEIIINFFTKKENYLLEQIKILEEEIKKRVSLNKSSLKIYPQFQKEIFNRINKIEIILFN